MGSLSVPAKRVVNFFTTAHRLLRNTVQSHLCPHLGMSHRPWRLFLTNSSPEWLAIHSQVPELPPFPFGKGSGHWCKQAKVKAGQLLSQYLLLGGSSCIPPIKVARGPARSWR
jgi:hypothetical protein